MNCPALLVPDPLSAGQFSTQNKKGNIMSFLEYLREVPVIPGKREDPRCVACGTLTVKIHRETHGGIDMLLCNDYRACSRTSGVIKI
jgi:hypothetical protein